MRVLARWAEAVRRLKIETATLYYAYKDPRTAWYAKTWAPIVVAYALSPIDLIPDFIPVLGYLDDLILVPLGIAVAIRLIPTEVYAECKRKAEQESGHRKPANWIVGAIIIGIWTALAAIVLSLIVRRLKGK